MPRRNIFWLIAITVVSLVCYQKMHNSRYGRILVEAMNQVQRRSLEPVKESTLFTGAMDGMIRQLDDPNSVYLPPKQYKVLNDLLDQELCGVGISVIMDPKTQQLTVIAPLAGSPAYRAGIQPGDIIQRIDDQSTQGLSREDAVARIHGKMGEPVVLTVLHEGEQKPVDIRLVRETIHTDSVWGDSRNADGTWNYLLEDHDAIGYARITSFGKDTARELEKALKELLHYDVKGLILDLRDNPGGLLAAAVDTCDLFIDSGVIVTVDGRNKQPLHPPFTASGKGVFLTLPMAVLVDRGSASASEIVAACLQDYHRAVIVGERTYGKGTVQEVLALPYGEGALKLTTASYWRPSGADINKPKNAGENGQWGVMPDKGYEVKMTVEELSQLHVQQLNRELRKQAGSADQEPGNGSPPVVDLPLAKAVEYLERD
jgi:carboxyl-terminal processing protease